MVTLDRSNVEIESIFGGLSPDTLNRFAGMELAGDWPPDANPLEGKFVRLGHRAIFLGARVPYNREGAQLRHSDIMSHGLGSGGVEAWKQIMASAPNDGVYLEDRMGPRRPLVDAGVYTLLADTEKTPIGLVLDGESMDFGRPDDAIRQQTIAVARELLDGTQIAITGK